MSTKDRMMDIMALCTTAIEDSEKAGKDPDKAAIIVNAAGKKRSGSVHRLFPDCPRGTVVKVHQIRGQRFMSIKFNAIKLRDALVDRVGQISGMRQKLEDDGIAKSAPPTRAKRRATKKRKRRRKNIKKRK